MRPARLFLTFLASFSLVLCLTTCILWARSYSVRDHFWRAVENGRMTWLFGDRGRWCLNVVSDWPVDSALRWVRQPMPHDLDAGNGREDNLPLLYSATFAGPGWDRFGFLADRGTVTTTIKLDPSARTRRGLPANTQDPYGTPPMPSVSVSGPFWIPAAVFALAPFAWITHRLRLSRHTRRARRLGHCVKCDYDLRATPGRCPECGAPARGSA